MNIDFARINWLAVLIAAIAAFMLGGLWYTALFGKLWATLNGYSPEKLAEMQKDQPPPIFFSILFACYALVSIAAALIVVALDLRTVQSGVSLGLVLFVIAAAVQATGHAANDKPWSAFAIDAAYQIIYFPMIGAILAAWRN